MKFKSIIFSDFIFSLITLLLVVLSILSYQRIVESERQSGNIAHTQLVKFKLEQILSSVKDAESGQRGFLISRDSIYLQPYSAALTMQGQIIHTIDSLLTDNTNQQRRNMDLLAWLVTKRLHRLGLVIEKSNLSPVETADLLSDGKIVMDQLKNLVTDMIRIEDEALEANKKSRRFTIAITPFYSLLLSVFAVLTVALSYFLLRAESRRRVDAEDDIKKLNDYFKDLPAVFSIVKGPTHVFEMANELFQQTTGNRPLIGLPFKDALPELTGHGFEELLEKVYRTGELYLGREIPVTLNDNNKNHITGYYNFIYKPLLNEKKEVEGILIFGYEITEMIAARDKMELAEQRSRLAIEAANIGTFDWDMEHQLFATSPRLVEIFGFGPDEKPQHKDLIARFHPADKPIRDKAIAESRLKGSLVYEARIVLPGGIIRWINVYGKVIHSITDNVNRMYGTALDITEQKTIVEELIKSEAQFRLLSDSMPQFVWTGDVRGNLNYFSKAVSLYSGLPIENFLQGGWIDIVHPDEREANMRQWQRAIANGEEFIFEHRVKNMQGEYRWHLSRALPQRSTSGDIQRWVGTSTDIQDQKNLSQKLEQQIADRTAELAKLNKQLTIQNNIFEEAEENALIGSYSWNLQTSEMEYSDNLFRLFGFEPNEFVPSFEKYLSLIHPEDKDQVMKDGQDTMSTQKLVAHTYRIITKDGRVKHFRSTGKIIETDENSLLIGTVQDISQDKLFSDLLQEKNLELERSNAELESFNYIASHDLQEPLRKIQAFSQRILTREEENLSSFSKDYFSRMNAAAARMQNLIDALLSYSRTSASNLEVTVTDLNQLVKEVINDLQDVIEEQKAVVHFSPLPSLPLVSIQVHQLFTNLISNAIKYSKPGISPVVNIKASFVTGKEIHDASADNKSKYWMISIKDNGIGFDQQYEHKIFELFQRLHGNAEYAGTGIGLAICKKIMRNHHGFISATGEPGVGATFNIYLPVVS